MPERKKQRRPRKITPRKITEDSLQNAGLFYLQRFACSSSRFREVMGRRIQRSCAAHPEQDPHRCREILESLVERFQRSGLLNDEAYAQGVAASLRRKGLSRSAVLSKLQHKGLDRDLAVRIVSAWTEEDGESELAAALRLVRRKRLASPETESGKPRNRALACLARAGFSFELAAKALDQARSETESA